MRYLRESVYVLVIIITALTINASAWAEDELLPDRFMIRLGGYNIRSADTIVRLDADGLPIGTYVDFQDTLGGDTSKTVFRMDGRYRFNDKHGLIFSWYALRFTGSRVLDRDIQWGDQIFPVNAQVSSELKFDVYKLSYQYSVYHNDKVELGASVGLHTMHVFANINAPSIGESQGDAITAPLPVLGLFADYNFTPRFSAYYNYQWFFINYQDQIKGGLQDFLIGLEYRVFRNVGLGFAYNRFALNAEAKGNAKTLNINTNWSGGMLYASVYF